MAARPNNSDSESSSSGSGNDDSAETKAQQVERVSVTTLKQEEWAMSPSDADYLDLAHANRAGKMALCASHAL